MECRKHVEAEYQRQGIHMYATYCPQKVVKKPDGSLTVTAKNGDDKEMVLEGVECVLMATGRKPNTKGIGLEQVGTALVPCALPYLQPLILTPPSYSLRVSLYTPL